MRHDVSVIGLGVMGQRMLTNMTAHDRFSVVAAWDPDAAACMRTVERFPQLRIADSAESAIAAPESSVVYVASPPACHREYALRGFAAGKAVYCEKPLGVDLAESRELVARAARSGQMNIVNFTLASAAAVRDVERRMAAGALGPIRGVDVRLHFATWPRDWQMDAASWLARRAQGGFTREVLSHWVYLTERLFGPVVLDAAHATYPDADGAETHLVAALHAGEIPVTVAGSVGGVGPDRVEYSLWGERESCRIHDWNRLRTSTGGDWVDRLRDLADPRAAGYVLQLDNAAAALAGETHSMPSFEDALRVQVTIESILAA
jgi:predicted dehydrogenase